MSHVVFAACLCAICRCEPNMPRFRCKSRNNIYPKLAYNMGYSVNLH